MFIYSFHFSIIFPYVVLIFIDFPHDPSIFLDHKASLTHGYGSTAVRPNGLLMRRTKPGRIAQKIIGPTHGVSWWFWKKKRWYRDTPGSSWFWLYIEPESFYYEKPWIETDWGVHDISNKAMIIDYPMLGHLQIASDLVCIPWTV